MYEPVAQSPLHGFGLDVQARAFDDSNGVWASETPFLGYISLRGNSANPAFVSAASSALGVALPVKPCTMTASNGVKVVWLSPDEWMIVCEPSRSSGLVSGLEHALKDIHSQVANNSGGYTQVLLHGRHATDVLHHVSVYDFEALVPGRVVGTTCGKSSLYVHRQGDGYCLLLRRSFADYIWRYLVRAATTYGLGIARVEGDDAVRRGVGS